jgi:hypothetical protein
MNARDALLKDRRVPWQIHVDERRGMLEIEAGRAGIGREEDSASGVVAKALDQRRALLSSGAQAAIKSRSGSSFS